MKTNNSQTEINSDYSEQDNSKSDLAHQIKIEKWKIRYYAQNVEKK